MMRSRLVRVGAVMAVLAAVAACSSTGSSASNSTAAVAPASVNFDPADAAFVAQLYAESLVPPVPQYGDAAYLADAENVCNQLGIPGESAAVVKTDMANLRKNRVSNYGITPDQAEQVMVLSVQTYCPNRLAALKTALG